MTVWPQKVPVTCQLPFWVERWGWEPSWQELRCEWVANRGRSGSGGEVKESEDTSGAQRKAAFQAWGRVEKQLRETGLEVPRAGKGLSRQGAGVGGGRGSETVMGQHQASQEPRRAAAFC